MKTILTLITAAFLLSTAAGAGLPPWQFGMTPAQVTSFKEFGPYKPFSNGDLETFNGRYHGRKENVQFFFEAGHLRRIGIYFGATQDTKKAVAMFERAYRALEQDYGKVEVPEMKVSGGGTPPVTVIAVGAMANADATGKTQMAPVKQPANMSVFSSAYRVNERGKKTFTVAIFLDKR
ncbi:MAG TPA: hypothetical protein VM940_15820 [Chthoniobacterales bacterium]|jgi:hypothetical protein|nr:hypothetical protein [Chthoniobacterales bacterium]